MDKEIFDSRINLIKNRADRYFQNALNADCINECNNYCVMISAKTGICFDTVRYLVRETIRRNYKI
jgi:hypothetical protein